MVDGFDGLGEGLGAVRGRFVEFGVIKRENFVAAFAEVVAGFEFGLAGFAEGVG